MQITIDKKTGVLLAIIALLGATVVSFAINGKTDHTITWAAWADMRAITPATPTTQVLTSCSYR